jgi:hypothetical protein
MNLEANECVNCNRPVGYVASGTLMLPTLCVVCVNDPDVMEEWGHKISNKEKPIKNVLMDLRTTLNRLDLR